MLTELMKNTTITLAALAFAALCISCEKQDRENTYISQDKSIDSYITGLCGNGEYRVVHTNSSNRVVIKEGAALDSLERGDSLYFYYSGYMFSYGKGEQFATNVEGDVKKIKYGSDKLISGLQSGLMGVREGEFCYIIFSAKYGFGNTIVFNLPKLTPLFYEITVDKVVKNK